MQYKSLELRVGFTILVAAVVLTIGLMWFQGFQVGRGTYDIQAVFPMVGGIGPGDKVSVNGVEMGSVKRVQLRDKDVLLTMELSNRAKIPADSRVVLQTVGIMGERIITILLGESDAFLEPGTVMEGVYEPGITEALAFLGNIMDDLTKLTKDMEQIATTLTEGDKLSRTVTNLAEITDRLRTVLREDAPELGAGVRSFRRSSEAVDRLLAKHSGTIDTMMTSFAEAGGEMPELVRRMRTLTDSLTAITVKLQRNDNSAGALLSDRAFMDRLEAAVKSLDELIADVKANPKKYLKVEIF